MHFEGEFKVPGKPADVIRRFADVPRMAGCMPGAVLEPQAEDGSWPGGMVVAFGPKKIKFKGKASVDFDFDALTGSVHGRGTADMRAARIGVKVSFALRDDPDAATATTIVKIISDAELGGVLADFARTGGIAVANVIMADFAKRAAVPEVRLGTDRAPDAILPIDAEHWWWGHADGWRAFDVHRGHSETVFVNCGGGDAPTTAALSADTAQIAMFEQRGNLVRLIKRSTGRTVGLFPSEWAHAMAFAPDGKHLYVLSAHALTVIDPAQSLDYRQAIGEAGSDMFCAPQ